MIGIIGAGANFGKHQKMDGRIVKLTLLDRYQPVLEDSFR